MILSKTITVSIVRNIKYYESLGYIIPRYLDSRNRLLIKQGTTINIKISHLKKSSRNKVLCKCDNCGKERWSIYRNYHPLCNSCAKIDFTLTDKERYSRANRSTFPGYKHWFTTIHNLGHCKICNGLNNLQAHHLNNWAHFKEQRTNIDNGVLLCESHHKDFHSKYGKRYTTKEMFASYYQSFQNV